MSKRYYNITIVQETVSTYGGYFDSIEDAVANMNDITYVCDNIATTFGASRIVSIEEGKLTEVTVLVPSWNNDMARILTNLYDEGGQSAVYDYVNEHHRDWDWDYCEPCECESPVFKTDAHRICAVCFTVFTSNVHTKEGYLYNEL